jgi:hypothetical protein
MGQYFKAVNLYATQEIEFDRSDPKAGEKVLASMRRTVGMEGQPVDIPADTVVGRWAGDRVALVGDYDHSKLWDKLPTYRNISRQVIAEWNEFIEVPEKQLRFNQDCGCNKKATRKA